MAHESLVKRLPYRARQLKFALFSRYKREHLEFAQKYLNIYELALFDRLPRFEKKHAAQVARLMLKRAHGKPEIDERKLVKIALLHDIGKAATKLSVLDKVILVIFNRYFKRVYDFLAEKGRSEKARSIYRKFYVYKYHDKIGAEMLKRAKVESAVVEAVARHGEPPSISDPVELQLLKKADTTY